MVGSRPQDPRCWGSATPQTPAKFNTKSKKAEEEKQKILAVEARLRANKEKRAAEREELSKKYKGYHTDVVEALVDLDESMNRSTKRAHEGGVKPVSKRKASKDDENMSSSSKISAEEAEEAAAKRKKR